MPIIELDSDAGKRFGFESSKFDGYLFRHGKAIWISHISSKQPHKGNLKKLFDTIESKGFHIVVPTPSNRMQMICAKRGMEYMPLENTDDGTVFGMAKPEIFEKKKLSL